MTVANSFGWLACACFLSLVVALAQPRSALSQETDSEDTAWELRPYRVLAAVVVPRDSRWTVRRNGEFVDAFAGRLESLTFDTWRLAVHRCDAVAAASAREFLRDNLPATVPAALAKAVDKHAADKLLVLEVAAAPGGWRLVCREFDVAWRRAGPVATRTVSWQASLAAGAASLAVETFCTQALVAEAGEGAAELRVRGPLIETAANHEPAFVVLAATNGKRDPSPPVDAGFRLSVIQSEEGAAKCKVWAPGESELRAAPEQPPWRALRIPETGSATTVRLQPIDFEPGAAANKAGFTVRVSAGPGAELLEVGQTDLNGECPLPTGLTGVRMFAIVHAGATLAEFPLVVGEIAVKDMPLPTSPDLLAAAEACQASEVELFDLAEKQAVFIARIRSQARAGRKEDARKLLEELRTLTAAPGLLDRIAVANDVASRQASAAGRRLAKRLRQLSSAARTLQSTEAVDALAKETGLAP